MLIDLTNKNQLVARLAFVDFDGKQALLASEKIGLEQQLDHQFLNNNMPKVVKGIDKLVEWLA